MLFHYYVIARTLWSITGPSKCAILHEANGYTNILGKRGNQQQCLLEIHDTFPAFVYASFVWDMKHLGTTRVCPVKAVMLVVWDMKHLGTTRVCPVKAVMLVVV